MAGNFYPIKIVLSDRLFLATTLGSMALCACGVTLLAIYTAQRDLYFEEIAKVRFVGDQSTAISSAKSIATVQGEHKSKISGEYFGYLSNIEDVCRDPAAFPSHEQTIVVTSPDGTASIARVKIGAEACEILYKLKKDHDYKVEAINASGKGDEAPSYFSAKGS